MKLMIARTLIVVFAAGAIACGGRSATLIPATSPEELAQTRLVAGRILDSASAASQIVDDTGRLIDALPLATADKDRFDCGVLRVMGADAPSPAVTSTCGPVPTIANAPLQKAVDLVRTAASCGALRTAVTLLLAVVDPFIATLEQAQNESLAFAARAIRTALVPARILLDGGTTCSAP